MAASTNPKATVAILSIGDMGIGIGRLLIAHGYRVITNVEGRSQATQSRARKNNVETMISDQELCSQADYVLSIVPQKDALSVANRVVDAVKTSPPRAHQLVFLELNAVSPSTARKTAELFAKSAPDVRVIDGGIISGPPKLKDDNTWFRPRLVVSGPFHIEEGPNGADLARVINLQHIDEKIGSASALKMCFAALAKGFTALAIQSFTTAHQFDIVDNLQELLVEYNPAFGSAANRFLPSMPPKAYRWVQEMNEIAETFEVDGGFAPKENVFGAMSHVFDLIAKSELGKEHTESRQRGKTAEEVASMTSQALRRRRST